MAPMLHAAALLDADESRTADKAAIASGTSGEKLMENAGKAVIDAITQKYSPCPVLIVCGTGNNGGDGFVTGRLLKERGWQVTISVVGDAGSINGDAKHAKDKWNMTGSPARTFSPALLKESKLVVDALFGTGLERNAEGPAKEAITTINESGLPVVSIDIPSGIHATTGAIMGVAVKAAHTVSFVRPKPGHVLLPGKAHTGELHVYNIGITGDNVTPHYFLNAPALWKHTLPKVAPDAHKYTRGHTLVMGGEKEMTGASRLAALAALRTGSGLCSIACSADALPIYASSLMSVMTKPFSQTSQLQAMMEDKHITASLIGPGCGATDATRDQVLQLLSHKKPCVLDADAISVFKANPKPLFAAIKGPTVLTPHEGEFERLFKINGPKPQRALEAAEQSDAVIVLKGNDTVIAAPDGRIAINANAPVWLATAGTGDVLAGMITGLMAQGMPAFEAACAATWMHGDAATRFGPGLISEDLPGMIPPVLKTLYYE